MNKKSIVFVAPPFAGHLNPILHLAQAAANVGYDVTVITSETEVQRVRDFGLTCLSLPCLGGNALEDIANTPAPVRGNPLKLVRQLRRSLEVSISACADLEGLWKDNKPALIVADSVAISAGLVADRLGIPWITTIATPFALECSRGTPSYVGGWKEGQGSLYSLRDKIGRYFIRRAKRAFRFVVRDELDRLQTGIYRADGSEAAYSPFSILGFGIPALEFDRDWPEVFKMIGPLYQDTGASQPAPIPKSSPKILVTLGTHLRWAKASFPSDLLWLAERCPNVTFVGSLGESSSAHHVEKIAENAEIHNFISYSQNMTEFDAVIHHGGAGITYAAIAFGKPSVVIPHDFDQFDFAARIEAKGAGVRVRKLRSNAAIKAIPRILNRENFPRLDELRHAAARLNPQEAFLAELDRVMGACEG